MRLRLRRFMVALPLSRPRRADWSARLRMHVRVHDEAALWRQLDAAGFAVGRLADRDPLRFRSMHAK